MKSPHCLALLILSSILALLTLNVSAQDDFSIPGLDEPGVTVTPAASSAAGTEGGASTEAKSLWDSILEGGWAMIPLALMLAAVIGVSVYLLMDTQAKQFHPPELSSRLQSAFEQGDFHSAMDESSRSATCLGQVVYGATEYIAERGYDVLDGEIIYDQMADASLEFNRPRAKMINYLSVLSQAAPMVGLLGTVSGMIKAFNTLGQKGNDPKELASNIGEALMTTATGLVIAIPAIFLYFYFRDRLTDRLAEVDRQTSKMLNSLRRVVYAQHEEAEEIEVPHS